MDVDESPSIGSFEETPEFDADARQQALSSSEAMHALTLDEESLHEACADTNDVSYETTPLDMQCDDEQRLPAELMQADGGCVSHECVSADSASPSTASFNSLQASQPPADSPYSAQASITPSSASIDTPNSACQPEQNPIARWKAAQQEKIRQRQELADARHHQILDQAVADITEFYAQYNAQKAATIAANREILARRDAAAACDLAESEAGCGDDVWAAVRTLLEKIKKPRGPSKDTSRLREVLFGGTTA